MAQLPMACRFISPFRTREVRRVETGFDDVGAQSVVAEHSTQNLAKLTNGCFGDVVNWVEDGQLCPGGIGGDEDGLGEVGGGSAGFEEGRKARAVR